MLVAILVRKASAMGLGNELGERHGAVTSPVQDRRWLWFCIGILDSQCALDRGSQHLLSAEGFACGPYNYDSSSGLQVPLPFSGFLDAPCWPLQCEAIVCLKRLNSAHPDQSYDSRALTVATFETWIKDEFTPFLDLQRPEHLLASMVAHESAVTMRLLVVRPLHKIRTIPSPAGISTLELAMGVLRSSLRKATTTEIHRWAWYSWVKWYALAVALVELCVSHHAVHADDTWDVVVLCFDRYAALIADGRTGLLWAPMKRLMARACQRRESCISQTCATGHHDTSDYAKMMSGTPSVQSHGMPQVRDISSFDSAIPDTLARNLLEGVQSEENGDHLIEDCSSEVGHADSAWLNWELFTDDMNLETFE